MSTQSKHDIISLNGSGWLVNFFQQAKSVTEKEFNIDDLRLHDGAGYKTYLPEGNTCGWDDGFVPSDVRDIMIAAGEMDDPH